jgi:biopolymer transport protein ExbD
MLRIPSSRIRKTKDFKLRLVPFADSFLVFIFFILFSATLYQVHDSGSEVAVATSNEASTLTLKIASEELTLLSGHGGEVLHRFRREVSTGLFSPKEIYSVLRDYKKDQKAIVFEPENELSYEEIITVLDAVKPQFKKIIFGNLVN